MPVSVEVFLRGRVGERFAAPRWLADGRVLLVGTTFLTVTTAMYALYMTGMYSALDFIGQMSWIRLAIAAIQTVLLSWLMKRSGHVAGIALYRAVSGWIWLL